MTSAKKGRKARTNKRGKDKDAMDRDELLALLTFDDKIETSDHQKNEKPAASVSEPKEVHRRFHKFL